MNKTTKWYAGPFYAFMALVLVTGLTLVPVASPIVEANVSNITVTVPDTTPATATNYTINFTTTVQLTQNADIITIDFPTGTTSNTVLSGLSTSNVTVNGAAPSSVSQGGRRVSVTPAANVAAGNVTVILGTGSNKPITNPSPEGTYTLTVYTTREPTTVTSPSYIIDTIISACTVNNTWNQTVNTSTRWNITATLTTALAANIDTITITFPATTTVPTSITAVSNVTIDGDNLDAITDYSVSGQNLTLTVPDDVATGAREINITPGTGLRNPTTIATNWTVQIYTSKDRGVKTSSTYNTTAGNMSVITHINWTSYDAYVPNNTISSAFRITTKDAYGNNATVNATANFALDGGTGGRFYNYSNVTGPIAAITIGVGNSSSTNFYYKCTSPGTKTVTASDLGGHGWTTASQSILVNPMVQLWGGGVNVANYSTINAAAAAALPYDIIKVLPSTYQPSSTITIDVDHLTLQSTGGASQTIINATNSGVGIDGGGINIHQAANVVVDGFTIENAPSCGIFCYDADNATIQNNIVTNSTAEITGIDVSWVATGVTVSGNELNEWAVMTVHGSNCTLSGNTFGRCINFWPNAGATQDKVYITNNTISGNVATGGINVMGTGASSAIKDSVIKDNTISNHDYGILVWASGSCYLNVSNLTITGNNITDNGEGINITANPPWRTNSTIRNNNIYNNTHYGINNAQASVTVNATRNWWGNVSGPGGVGPGTGDNVTSYVTYSPWRDAAYPGGNATAFTNITLKKDWNFISVPRKMENATFGWLLSGQNISQSYGYDPSAGWIILNGSSPVEVLAGYWVSANEAGIINLTFVSTGQEVPASKNLTGKKWNAIGFSDTTALAANATLKSVEGSWSTAMGWNAADQCYDNSIIYSVNDSTTMTPGKGYWLWMTANDTLAALSA